MVLINFVLKDKKEKADTMKLSVKNIDWNLDKSNQTYEFINKIKIALSKGYTFDILLSSPVFLEKFGDFIINNRDYWENSEISKEYYNWQNS